LNFRVWGKVLFLRGNERLGKREVWSGVPFPGVMGSGLKGLGFRIQGSGFGVQDSGFRVKDLGFRVQGSGFRI
jgi:hypothetical protein